MVCNGCCNVCCRVVIVWFYSHVNEGLNVYTHTSTYIYKVLHMKAAAVMCGSETGNQHKHKLNQTKKHSDKQEISHLIHVFIMRLWVWILANTCIYLSGVSVCGSASPAPCLGLCSHFTLVYVRMYLLHLPIFLSIFFEWHWWSVSCIQVVLPSTVECQSV